MRTHVRNNDLRLERIILASQSYSRQRLMALAGIDVEILPSNFDEYAVRLADFAQKEAYVATIATGKVLEVADRVGADTEHTYIVGGDLVVFVDHTPYYKPTSITQAREYMETLVGRSHEEVCATAFWSAQTGVEVATESILVTVPELTPAEIDEYLELAHPLEKTAGFSIVALQKILRQRSGDPPLSSVKIVGSMSGLLGISLTEVERFFASSGLEFPVPAHLIEHQLSNEILTGEFAK